VVKHSSTKNFRTFSVFLWQIQYMITLFFFHEVRAQVDCWMIHYLLCMYSSVCVYQQNLWHDLLVLEM
jgi:hypothetical protein